MSAVFFKWYNSGQPLKHFQIQLNANFFIENDKTFKQNTMNYHQNPN